MQGLLDTVGLLSLKEVLKIGKLKYIETPNRRKKFNSAVFPLVQLFENWYF